MIRQIIMDILKQYGFDLTKKDSNKDRDSDLNSFDTIFLLDLSGSMYNEDFNMENMELSNDSIKDDFDSKFLKNFISEIVGEKEISRYRGALTSILLYVIKTVERKEDNNISIIPFSDSAEAIRFEGKKYFSSSNSDLENIFDRSIKDVEEFLRGKTDIRSALEESIEVIKKLKKDRMKMIVLLTDQNSDQKDNDPKIEIQNLINDRLSPREDVVINTVGLGDDVDEELLNSIASKTGGEFIKAEGIGDLDYPFSRFSKVVSEKSSMIFDG